MSITPPVLIVKETTAGLVFLKEKNSVVLVPKLPIYNPIVIAKETTPKVVIVNSGAIGPQGKTGPEGPQGKEGKEGPSGSGDLHFKFTQGSAAEKWEIVHGLGKFPTVTVQDSANENVEGFVEYKNINELVVTFSAAFSGQAYLN